MIKKEMIFRAMAFGLAAVSLLSISIGITSANAVPETRLGISATAIDANAIKPSQCSAIDLLNIVIGSGKFTGDKDANLILGSSGDDEINGQNGDDCILGGGGNDSIRGGPGNDICIGGSGTDSFSQCEVVIQDD